MKINRKLQLISILTVLSAILFPVSTVHANDTGVDDLRGRWDFEWSMDDDPGFAPQPLILYVNDMRPSTYVEGRYYAAGCMRSPETDAILPLSLQADFDSESNSYTLAIFSTIVPTEDAPYVVRFSGELFIYGEGVTDDEAGGVLRSERGFGQWTGTHHDRRQTKCPSVGDVGGGAQGDVYAHMDLAYGSPRHVSLFEAFTVIVSSGMLVEAPNGSSFVIQEYTDIFSPDVDFIGRFRYLDGFDGPPISGGTYNFVLLDVFGEPIPGTESSDVWVSCNQDPPTGLTVSDAGGGSVELAWDDVPTLQGEFDPLNEVGFYQIGISPFNWEGETNYGASGIMTNSHVIPWSPFVQGQEGQPNGYDFGHPLSEMQPGLYQVQAEAFGQPLPNSEGSGHECSVFNTAEGLTLRVGDAGELEFASMATISGTVEDQGGQLLSGIDVGACDYYDDQGFCSGDRTDDNGSYTILLPAGDYRVGAFPESGYLHEFFDEKAYWHEADPVTAVSGQATIGVNFTLQSAGTITGTVTDQYGDAIPWIDVNACEYVESDETYCSGGQSDESGKYSIIVPGGSYRVFVHGQSGWANEYYQDTPLHEHATEVFVTDGEVTPFIDFMLAPGGSISGTVFDASGENALGGIGVDNDEGGYGTCTDEHGYYEITGLPLGSTFNVVAGHTFCGDEHPFDLQIIEAVDVGSTGVDFFLSEASQYQPTLHVVPAHPEIHGHEWNPGSPVTLYVDNDDDLGNGFLYSETKLVGDEPTWCGQPCFDLTGVPELPGGIQTGNVVTMDDGDATRIVNVTSLMWIGASIEDDTVYGTAAPYADIEVSVHGPVWGQRTVQANGSGDWVADFSIPGTGESEQDIVDLGPGYHGRSIEFEGGVPDDGTLAYWSIEEPPDKTIIAHPDHEWVSSHGWNVGESITMYIDDNTDPFGDGYLLMMSGVAEGPEGQVQFDSWEPFDLTPDMYVIVTDGVSTETLLVETLSVDELDEDTDIVRGSAPAGRDVGVGVQQPGQEFWLVVTSNGGLWEADFSPDDLNGVFGIHAMLWDEDGDATQANYDFPSP